MVLAVIGSNWGDEGKALVTDFLCAREHASLVVRFNGGAQAGHTVVTPDGRRHIFSHFGSGSFLGVPTFWSKFCVANPASFVSESTELQMLGCTPTLYVDLDCPVTTPLDMLINQAVENHRKHERHGSCGIGFNETLERSQYPEFDVRVRDLKGDLEDKLERIARQWVPRRLKALGLPESAVIYDEGVHEHFLADCDVFFANIISASLEDLDLRCVVFEGAQGLLLDQGRVEYHPHLTRSNTGIKNVRILCAEADIDNLDGYYVSRTYTTRHGAGPFPGETCGVKYFDDTNTYGNWQGPLRFGTLNYPWLLARCFQDFGAGYKLVFTHCDQLPAEHDAALYFNGPTRENVMTISSEAAA